MHLHALLGADLGEVMMAAALVACLFTGLLILISRRATHDLDAIPGPWKRALPIIGNIHELLRPDFHKVLLNWADEFGGVVRVKFLWKDALIVTDPAALGAIMGRGEGALDKASAAYAPINAMCTHKGSPNLLTSAADDTWKAVRRAVAVAFSAANIKKKHALITGRANDLVARIAAQGPDASIDVDQAALRVTLDVIGLAGFGHDYQAVTKDVPEYDHLLRVLPRCFTEVMLRIANPLRAIAPGAFKTGPKGAAAFKQFRAEMRALLDEVKAKGAPAADDQSIAAQLMRVMAERPHDVDEERILSEIGMLFVEGFETTGHSTAWSLLHAATAPGVQDKIAEELDAAGLLHKPGCPPPRELTYDDLKRLPYLTAVAKEAMRVLPVVSLMGRVAERPTKVGKYSVPTGTLVGTPLYAIQNTKHNWSDAREFKPERWLNVAAEAYVTDVNGAARASAGGKTPAGIAYMPFSEGPRSCVGQSLAKAEVMTLLVKLLGSFRIELAPEMGGLEGVLARESTHLTLQTRGTKGIRCRMAPRSEHVAAGVVCVPIAEEPEQEQQEQEQQQ